MTAREQLHLMDEIRDKANINMVTCGHCGSILLHRMNDEMINCYSCKRDMNTNDCTDYWYEGMPELDEDEYVIN